MINVLQNKPSELLNSNFLLAKIENKYFWQVLYFKSGNIASYIIILQYFCLLTFVLSFINTPLSTGHNLENQL